MQFPPGQFGLIYIDPPWEYKMRSDKGYEKSPQKHYPCMSQDKLLALRDQILFATAPDAVLLMWTVFGADDERDFIQDALNLISAYGFRRKSGGPWNKLAGTGNPAMGTGYCFRGAAELFFLATRGRPKFKNKSQRNVLFTGDVPDDLLELPEIIVNSLRREHSRKPDAMYDMIESLFYGPYLEIFARTQRPGWSCAGNETEKF